MKILFVINESPWGSALSSTALRIAAGAVDAHHDVHVFFREDGVYNAQTATVTDSEVADLAASWAGLHRDHGVGLMVCQASAARRLTESLAMPFRSSSLVEFTDLLADCDRVVTF